MPFVQDRQAAREMLDAARHAVYAEAARQTVSPRRHTAFAAHRLTQAQSADARARIEKMYPAYAQAFPLAREKETLESLLALNTYHPADARVEEEWIILQSPDDDVVGAVNVMNLAVGQSGISGVQTVPYIFVAPAWRGDGVAARLWALAGRSAADFFGDGNFVQLAEQNSPMAMPPAAFLEDIAGTGMDPFARRAYFERIGFRGVDFEYIQLPLLPRAAGGEECRFLQLVARGVPAAVDVLPADVFEFWLRHFSAYLAKDGYDVTADAVFQQQLAAARERKDGIRLLPAEDYAGRTRRAFAAIAASLENFDAEAFNDRPLRLLAGL